MLGQGTPKSFYSNTKAYDSLKKHDCCTWLPLYLHMGENMLIDGQAATP